ncbi:MAG: hypothetical protein ABR570_17810 [Burkholderiales bacterium]
MQMESTMLKKTLFTLATTAVLAFSGAALADPPHWAPAYGYYKHKHHRHYYAPAPVVVPAPRVVYAPPPPVAYPYYAAPVIVQPEPVAVPVYPAAPAGVSIRFHLPL